MPRNGSGGYALPSGINPVITQTLITSSWANTTLADVAAAITQSIAKDGQTIPTANLPMGGFRHTSVGDPVLRDNYATLGYVQDGSHYQLINIAGNNSISSVLPGGLTAYSLGMVVQLQPVATSTGPITLDVNGIGARPITSGIGNQLGSGDLLVGQAYLLMYNGTSWEILNGGDSGAFAQAAITGWDRPAAVAYPPITQVNPNTVFVPGGTGRIVDPSARDISDVTEVTWADQNVVLNNIASQWVTILGVNASGDIVQLTGSAMPAAARSNIILGVVTHVTGVIGSIKTRPTIYGDEAYMSYDTSSLFNNMLLSGGNVAQNAAPMHMDLSPGFIFSIGGNADQMAGPNMPQFVGQINFNFYPVTGASTNAAITNVAPVANYDPLGAGVITAIPGGAGTTSIHRLYLLGDQMLWLYGQYAYTDISTAIREWAIDTQILKLPAKLNNATLIATVIATKGCVSLADVATCRIVPAGGTSYSIGTAGSIADAPSDSSSYGRKNAAWSKVVDAVINGDGIAVDSTNPNKPIVSVGSAFAGPKTLTSGAFNLSATSDILWNKANFNIIAGTGDGADNKFITVSGGGSPAGVSRGAYLELHGNEEPGAAGSAQLWSGGGAEVTLGGGNINIPTGSIFHSVPGAGAGILYSSIDWRIYADTVDGADNKRIIISGGGSPAANRGAFISLTGNEQAGAGVAIVGSGTGANVELAPGGTGDVKITGGRLFGTALHNNAQALVGPTNQFVGSGTYNPTVTPVANVSAVTAQPAQWMRVGNVVTVSGRTDLSATAAAATLTTFRMSLPIASNFTTNTACGGIYAGSAATQIEPGTISPDQVNDAALFSFYSVQTGSRAGIYSFTYLVA